MRLSYILLFTLFTWRHINVNSISNLTLFPFLAHQDEGLLVQNISICTVWISGAPKSHLFPRLSKTLILNLFLQGKCSSPDSPRSLIWSCPFYQCLSCVANSGTGCMCGLTSVNEKGIITDQLAVPLLIQHQITLACCQAMLLIFFKPAVPRAPMTFLKRWVPGIIFQI